jgi:KaiC/GvpD/RAD55 family RecA-like ATPase
MASKKADIRKEITTNDIVVFLIPNNTFQEKVTTIAEASAKSFDSICYVSLNKPYQTLLSVFQKQGIDPHKIVFIDGVTAGFKQAGLQEVVFVSSPRALTEINIAINKVIQKDHIQHIIFDSISTLLAYEQPSTVIKFSHSVISSLRAAKIKGAFVGLVEDSKGELVKDLSMFVDKVIVI